MTPIKAAADPSREFVEEIRKYWSFDNDQMHTHSWHDRENFIARKLPSLLAKFAPAGNAGVRERLETIANEVIGIQEDLPSEDDRNTLGFAAHYLRKFAALPQPREAFADGGNCEHGIAKVNCGICVPSEVFSGESGS